jgi:hypothetical protein
MIPVYFGNITNKVWTVMLFHGGFVDTSLILHLTNFTSFVSYRHQVENISRGGCVAFYVRLFVLHVFPDLQKLYCLVLPVSQVWLPCWNN